MNQLRRATALLLRRLRLDYRGAGGHLVRLFSASMLLVTIVAVVTSSSAIGSPGLVAFQWVCWCDALLISAASMTVFASVIAAEREGGTLGLLRMTGTSPLTLLLGQGVGGIVIGCLLLAIQLPFVVLTITLGGVLWDQVLASFLALFAHLVLCAGAGLFFSTVCKRSGSAAFYALLLQLALWIGPWGARWLAGRMNAAGRITAATEATISSISSTINTHLVWNRLGEIATSFGVTELIGPQFWCSVLFGALFLGLSAVVMDYRPIEVPPTSPLVIALWKPARGRAWNRWPIPGKDFRQFMGGRRGVIGRLLVYTVVPLGSAWLMNRYAAAQLDGDDLAAVVFWSGFAFLVIEGSAIAARLFRNELAEQTWSTLVLLPEPFLFIGVQKLAGAMLGLLPAFLVTAAAYSMSPSVQEHWRRSFWRGEGLIPIVMVIFFLSSTSVASMLATNLPPTVIVFFAILAYLVHYVLTVLAAFTIRTGGPSSMHHFNYFYAAVWLSASLVFLIVALVRLRKLTERY